MQALDARAFIARYRLAPEHPLPAAHEDCFAAYRGLLAKGHDPRRIVVMGDSAGGLLVLAVLQRIRDAGLPAPSCGVMFSSGADLEEVAGLDADATRGDPMIGPGVLELLQRVVIAPVDMHDPAVSPCAGSLAGLPPLLFQAGSTELLLDQSQGGAEGARRRKRGRAAGLAANAARVPGGALAARSAPGARVRPRLRRASRPVEFRGFVAADAPPVAAAELPRGESQASRPRSRQRARASSRLVTPSLP